MDRMYLVTFNKYDNDALSIVARSNEMNDTYPKYVETPKGQIIIKEEDIMQMMEFGHGIKEMKYLGVLFDKEMKYLYVSGESDN